jgi:fibronectin-binding autotransporter adhesin
MLSGCRKAVRCSICHRFMLLAGAAVCWLLADGSNPVHAGPDPCTGVGTVTCTGNQSAGVANPPAGTTVLNVGSLTADIVPAAGVAGIEFTSNFIPNTTNVGAAPLILNASTVPFKIILPSASSSFVPVGVAAAGGGAVTVDFSGSIIGQGGGIGISAFTLGATSDLNVTASGSMSLSGSGGGVEAFSPFGAGAVRVTSSADISAPGGIYAFSFGGSVAVANSGAISVAVDQGTGIRAIAGGSVQVNSSGTVAVTGQSGLGIIAGSNSNLGVTIANSGNVTATTGIQIAPGQSTVLPPVSNNIVNTGTISGTLAAIDLLTAPGPPNRLPTTISQQAGAIVGPILLSPVGDTVNVSGGTISGDIVGNSATSGTNAGTVNFNLGAGGSFATGGNIDVANVNITSGTVLLANDITVFNALTNNAGLQIDGSRTVTGRFVQSAAGTLVAQITPQSSSQLNVRRGPSGGGTASLAGTLALAYAPGTYQPRTYSLITTEGGITGAFANVTGTVPTPGISQTISVGPTAVDLTLTQGSGPPNPPNPTVVSPTNSTVFPAVSTSVVLTGQQMAGIVLDRLGTRLTSPIDGPVAGYVPIRVAQRDNLTALGGIASALPQAFAAESVWVRGIGDFLSLRGSGNVPGLTGAAGGFLAGFDRPVAPGFIPGPRRWLSSFRGERKHRRQRLDR